MVIPKNDALHLLSKWIPGSINTKNKPKTIMKHPKSVLMEWSQSHSTEQPKTEYSGFMDPSTNTLIWTAKVTFCGQTVEEKSIGKKKSQKQNVIKN